MTIDRANEKNLYVDCHGTGLHPIPTPPYYPQLNDQAERFVDPLKRDFLKRKDHQ